MGFFLVLLIEILTINCAGIETCVTKETDIGLSVLFIIKAVYLSCRKLDIRYKHKFHWTFTLE